MVATNRHGNLREWRGTANAPRDDHKQCAHQTTRNGHPPRGLPGSAYPPQKKWNEDDENALNQRAGETRRSRAYAPAELPAARTRFHASATISRVPNGRVREHFLFFLQTWNLLNQFTLPLCPEEASIVAYKYLPYFFSLIIAF